MSDKKTALVTGGSRGIGLAISQRLLKMGYSVMINGVREESAVTQLKSLKAAGEVHYCQANIGTEEGRSRLVESVRDQFGVISVLVNNAGIAPPTRNDILEITGEEYDQVMDVNLKGTFFLTQALARDMLNEKQDHPDTEACIINISSISAEVASINRAAYCLSKAGVSMLTKLLAVKMSAVAIPVYEVRPGIIRTDMTAAVTEKYEQMIAKGLTLEPRMGTPEDVARIVGMLIHGDLPYATGQVLTADGGMGIRRL